MSTTRACALLVALFAWYIAGAGRVLTSGDDSSYVSAAVDLARGESLVHRFESRVLATEYVAIGSRPAAYAIKYPIGLPLLLAPFYRLAGFPAFFWLGPLCGVLGVLALYRLTLQLTDDHSTALVAAAVLATLPPLIFNAAGIGSDLPSLALVTGALWLHARETERPTLVGFALVCALCGVAMLVRNPNVLVLAAIGGHEWLVRRGARRAQCWRWALGAAVVLILGAVQLGTNWAVYGTILGGYRNEIQVGSGLDLVPRSSPATQAIEATKGRQGVGAGYMAQHIPGYLLMLCVVPPLGLPAMLWTLRRRGLSAHGLYACLAAIVVAFVMLYGSWWAWVFDYDRAFVAGSRFLLPVLPILCLFLAVALRDALPAARTRHALVSIGLIAQVAASAVLTTQLRAYKGRMSAHRDSVLAATTPDALVIGPGAWAKLFSVHDHRVASRRYASYHAGVPGSEMQAVVERTLDAGQSVFLLGSGSSRGGEQLVLDALEPHYRIEVRLDTQRPYPLRVRQVMR